MKINKQDTPLKIGDRVLTSRFFLGTGKFKNKEELRETIQASGTEIVTVALRRVDIGNENDETLSAIDSSKYDMIICNFANADMVGHSGNYDAAVKAVETLDNCLGRVWSALKQVGGEMLVTADHGNAELMTDEESGQPHTAHTHNPVPLIYAGRAASCVDQGSLADIAPTLLSLMDLPIPDEMGQHLLVNLNDTDH